MEAGLRAKIIVLSATLAESCECLVQYGFEPAVCELGFVESLARVADETNKRVLVHLKVGTGIRRMGVMPDQVIPFLDRCRDLPAVHVRGS